MEGWKKKFEKVVRQAGLASMVAGKMVSADAAEPQGMAGNREALKKLDGTKIETPIDPNSIAEGAPEEEKKGEIKYVIREDE